MRTENAIFAILLCSLAFTASNATAAQVTLAWDLPSLGIPTGYRICYGTTQGNHPDCVDVGNVTQYTLTGLQEGIWYYSIVKAYNNSAESGPSNEIYFQTLPDGLLDNDDAGTSSTGLWNVSGVSGFYGTDSLFSREPGATYTFEAAVNGSTDVYLWWTAASGRCTDVPVNIYDGDILLESLRVNQQANGSQWNLLNTYVFSGTARVEILSQYKSCSTCADAVRFVDDSI